MTWKKTLAGSTSLPCTVQWSCLNVCEDKKRPRADPVVCTWRGTASQVLSPVKKERVGGQERKWASIILQALFPAILHGPWCNIDGFPYRNLFWGLTFIFAWFLPAPLRRRWLVMESWLNSATEMRVKPNKEARAAVALIGSPELQFKVAPPVCGTDSDPGSGLWETHGSTQRWRLCMWFHSLSFFKKKKSLIKK